MLRRWKLGVLLVGSALALTACLGPGTYTVSDKPGGGAVQYGTWHTLDRSNCHWNIRDRKGNIIASSYPTPGKGPGFVEIASSDGTFELANGCSYRRFGGLGDIVGQYGGPDNSIPVPGDGEFRVLDEVPYGTWQAVSPGPNCHWQRVDSFRGTASVVYEDSTATTVKLQPGDRHFITDDCGSWIRIAP